MQTQLVESYVVDCQSPVKLANRFIKKINEKRK